MKRIVPRVAIIAVVLVIVMSGTVLAANGGILGFLHTGQLGEIQIQSRNGFPIMTRRTSPSALK